MFVKGPPAAAQDDHVIVSFTFDDAWDTQYSALSVFGDHDMRATFYVNTGTVGSSLHLSWAQLHQLADAGHEIGGHTVNHAALTDIDEATARAEIQGDITTLQAQGFPRPVSFAYPFGYHGPDQQRYVREAGYASARTTDIYQRESNPPANAYALRIPRGSLDGSEGLAALKKDVTDAEAAPGRTHLVYVLHDFYSPIDSEVRDFLAWLQAEGRPRHRGQDRGRRHSRGTSRRSRPQARPRRCRAGSTVHLDGSGSSDPNGDPLTYQWSQTGSPSAHPLQQYRGQGPRSPRRPTRSHSLFVWWSVTDGQQQSGLRDHHLTQARAPANTRSPTIAPQSVRSVLGHVQTRSMDRRDLLRVQLGGQRRGLSVVATGTRLSLKASMLAKKVTCAVTAHGPGGRASKGSAGVVVARGRALKATTAPKITGAAVVGQKLTAGPGKWSPAAGRYAYRWYRNGRTIAGAIHRTYEVQSADRGTRIKVKVAAIKRAYVRGVAFSVSRRVEK